MSLTTMDEALECIRSLRDRLIAYATEDGIAKGYGFGCMTRPEEYIKAEVDKANAFIEKNGGNNG